MSITKRSKKKNGKSVSVYHAEVYVRGVRLASQAFETKGAALLWHEQKKTKLTCSPGTRQSEKLAFSDCLDQYVAFAKNRLRESTLQSYELRIGYLRDSMLAKLRVNDISAEVIDLWIEWLTKQPTALNRGRSSFNKEIELLSVVLNWYRNYLDATYVVPITRRHRERAIYKPVRARRPDYFARPEEIRAWIEWLRDHRKPVYANLATFMVLTGCRVGEATALSWDAVDLDRHLARIVRTTFWDHWTKQPKIVEATKTDESNRIVILPDMLVALLRELKAQSGEQQFLFPNFRGEPLKYNAIQSAFNAGFKALNLPWRSTHICRHTYATMALFATRDLTSVQASLGHKKREMTEKYAKAVALLNSGTAEKTAAVFDLSPKSRKNHVLTIGVEKIPE